MLYVNPRLFKQIYILGASQVTGLSNSYFKPLSIIITYALCILLVILNKIPGFLNQPPT